MQLWIILISIWLLDSDWLIGCFRLLLPGGDVDLETSQFSRLSKIFYDLAIKVLHTHQNDIWFLSFIDDKCIELFSITIKWFQRINTLLNVQYMVPTVYNTDSGFHFAPYLFPLFLMFLCLQIWSVWLGVSSVVVQLPLYYFYLLSSTPVVSCSCFVIVFQTNDASDYFPIWGTCQGLQQMTVLSSNKSLLTLTETKAVALPLTFTPGQRPHWVSAFCMCIGLCLSMNIDIQWCKILK